MIIDKMTLNWSTHLYMERFINDGSPSGFSDSLTSSQPTKAKSVNKEFHLIGLRFSDQINIQDYGEKPKFAEEWQMLVHPDMAYNPKMNSLLEKCTDFDLNAVLVEPTASIRTVKALIKDDWFIKLHYDGILGRIDRKIQRKHAISAVEVSAMMQKAIDQSKLSSKFFIQREPFARIIDLIEKNSQIYEWGIVLREPLAYPYNNNIKFLIPAFSLFSKDTRNPEHKSILTQLIEKQSKNAEDYLFEDLITPIFENYFGLLLNCGLQPECHAQNTLIAIDENFNIIGIVIKDAESIDKDLSLMADLGIKCEIESSDYKCLKRSDYNYWIMHSFMFDFKLGEYLISPIINNATENFPDFNAGNLIKRIKEYNSTFIKSLPKDFFPSNGKWYSDKKEIRDRSKEKEYVVNTNPKFR